MDKNDAIKIIVSAAERYRNNLEDKNLLFIYKDRDTNKVECLETLFESQNFMHLTGVVTPLGSNYFYKKCINHKLSPSDFDFNKNGLTKLKIPILNQITNINKSAKMIGTYNNIKPILYTEKVTGNPHACLGFVKDDNSPYYVPNTALKEDIRDITESSMRVLAILCKNKYDDIYTTITYLAKKITFDNIILPSYIRSKINISK